MLLTIFNSEPGLPGGPASSPARRVVLQEAHAELDQVGRNRCVPVCNLRNKE
jgi:hypothetical protein